MYRTGGRRVRRGSWRRGRARARARLLGLALFHPRADRLVGHRQRQGVRLERHREGDARRRRGSRREIARRDARGRAVSRRRRISRGRSRKTKRAKNDAPGCVAECARRLPARAALSSGGARVGAKTTRRSWRAIESAVIRLGSGRHRRARELTILWDISTAGPSSSAARFATSTRARRRRGAHGVVPRRRGASARHVAVHDLER